MELALCVREFRKCFADVNEYVRFSLIGYFVKIKLLEIVVDHRVKKLSVQVKRFYTNDLSISSISDGSILV